MFWIKGIRLGAMEIPEKKYFLVDIRFPTYNLLITPYRAIRYYL
jgi:hypothetical protein